MRVDIAPLELLYTLYCTFEEFCERQRYQGGKDSS